MAKIAFSTTPPMDWNNGVGNRSIMESLERLVLRAKATDESIPHGEWLQIWKAVGDIMGNSEPTEVCDPNKSGAEYLDVLIASLGGTTTANPVPRNVFKMNGTDQYFDMIDERSNGAFLLAFTFYGTVGIAHPLTSHDVDASYVSFNAVGDLLVQIGGSSLITIPSATVGSIATPKRIEVGRANSDVRVRIDGTTVASLENHGNNRFGVRYVGTDQNINAFSDGAFYDIQFTNRNGDHFYIADDRSATLADTGTAATDGTVVNHQLANWIEI